MGKQRRLQRQAQHAAELAGEDVATVHDLDPPARSGVTLQRGHGSFSTPAQKLAARESSDRARLRLNGLVVVDGEPTDFGRALRMTADARRAVTKQLDEIEREAVIVARMKGLSWDRISVLLGGKPTGRHLRDRYADVGDMPQVFRARGESAAAAARLRDRKSSRS